MIPYTTVRYQRKHPFVLLSLKKQRYHPSPPDLCVSYLIKELIVQSQVSTSFDFSRSGLMTQYLLDAFSVTAPARCETGDGKGWDGGGGGVVGSQGGPTHSEDIETSRIMRDRYRPIRPSGKRIPDIFMTTSPRNCEGILSVVHTHRLNVDAELDWMNQHPHEPYEINFSFFEIF